MTLLKRLALLLTLLVGLVGLAATGIWVTASSALSGPYDDIRGTDLPVPWPLSDDARSALIQEAVDVARVEGREVPADPSELVDLVGAAERRAVERGEYLATTVGNCVECHGTDLGGKVVMDEPMVTRLVAPNLTAGRRDGPLTPEQWDRAIRHAVGPDGRALLMPGVDYAYLADRDVSDVIAWARSLPPVTDHVPDSAMGPILAMLIATGGKPLDVDLIDHDRPRPTVPPPAAADATWGAYIVQTCKGCHGTHLSGGPIPGGPPDWPPPSNLTMHETGLADWTYDQFVTLMREGLRPDGRQIHPAMPIEAMSKLEDRDLEAMWAHLEEVEPRAFGQR